MSYSEIYNRCVTAEKRKSDRLNPWLYYVVRPISIVITAPLLKTNILPITVTAISIISSLAGFCFISFSHQIIYKIFGWFCFFNWAILDCVDGNIARFKNIASKRGELWDAAGGYIALSLIFFASGIAAYYDRNLYHIFPVEYYLIAGGMTSLLSLLPRLIAQKKKAINSAESVKNVMDKTTFNLPKILIMNLESAIGIMQVVLLICILTHTLNIYIMFYFILNVCITIYSLNSLLR